MVATPAEFETRVGRKSGLIRKALQGGVFLAPWPTGPVIATLTATAGQISIDALYESVGWLSEDGLSFSVDTEASELKGWGSGTVLRRDVTSQTETVQFVALETKKLTKELELAMSLPTTMSVAGEVVITKPSTPGTKYWRALMVGVDGDGTGRYYVARHFAKCSAERGDQTWTSGDEPLGYDTTLTSYVDDAAGFAVREFIFGPGALAAAVDMGFVAGP